MSLHHCRKAEYTCFAGRMPVNVASRTSFKAKKQRFRHAAVHLSRREPEFHNAVVLAEWQPSNTTTRQQEGVAQTQPSAPSVASGFRVLRAALGWARDSKSQQGAAPSAVPIKVFGHVVYSWACKHLYLYARSRWTSGQH